MMAGGLQPADDSTKRIWTILDVIRWATGYLQGKGIDSPRLTSELLLSHILQCRRIDLYKNFDRPLISEELSAFKSVLARRLKHEPVQYIVGETEFMGLRFRVDSRVLIPRPETELLVESSLKRLASYEAPAVLDIGTGSGCIAVSLAVHNRDCRIEAIDVEQGALEVAKENAHRNDVADQITFRQMNVLSGSGALPSSAYDFIVSNPPYISATDSLDLASEIRDFEPMIAASDGADGLTFYRLIAREGNRLLRDSGGIAVEISYSQSAEVPLLFRESGFDVEDVIADYGGIDRVVIVRKRK